MIRGMEKQSALSLTKFDQGNSNTPLLAEVYRRDSDTSSICNLKRDNAYFSHSV